MCLVSVFSPEFHHVALVGGNWNNTSRAGLWLWAMNKASTDTNTNFGARLIILRYTLRDLVCLVRVFSLAFSLALVGGRYDNGLKAGLWYWNLRNDSSNANSNIGARPLIFKSKYLHIIFLSPC